MAEENQVVEAEAPSHEREAFFNDLGNMAAYKQQVDNINLVDYQRQLYVPPELTKQQLSLINENAAYGRGTQTNQRYNRELYQRQNQVARQSFAATSAQWSMDAAVFTGASAVATTLGVGALAGIAAPLAISYAAMYPVRASMDREIKKRQETVGIANDISMYKDQLGLKHASFGEIDATAYGLRGSMSKGGFWSKKDQLKMHSIAVGEGVLDALKPESTDTQGNVAQYKKNFDELKSVTKDIVETLHTTMEGGLALIKDMKQKGYTSMQKIRTELLRAKAFGDASGVGVENMLRIQDAGGERAYAQGMTRDYGSSMYRTSYTQLNQQALGSQAMAQSVNRVGGLEAATQIINDANVNFIQSKLGTQVWAASTKADGTVDDKFLARMNRGDVSASELINRAHNRGSAMDESGRALAERRKMEFFEKAGKDGTAFLQTQAMIKGTFKAWLKDRPDITAEAGAQKFAEMQLPGEDMRAQSLFADQLLSADKTGYLKAVKLSADLSDSRISGSVAPMNPLRRMYNKAVAGVSGFSSAMGKDLVDISDKIFDKTSRSFSDFRYGLAGSVNNAIIGAFGTKEEKELYYKYGGSSWAPVEKVSQAQMARMTYSLDGVDQSDIDAFIRKGRRDRPNDIRGTENKQIDASKVKSDVENALNKKQASDIDKKYKTWGYDKNDPLAPKSTLGRKTGSQELLAQGSELTDEQIVSLSELSNATKAGDDDKRNEILQNTLYKKDARNSSSYENLLKMASGNSRQTEVDYVLRNVVSKRTAGKSVQAIARSTLGKAVGNISKLGATIDPAAAEKAIASLSVEKFNDLYDYTNQVNSGLVDINSTNNSLDYLKLSGLSGAVYKDLDVDAKRSINSFILQNAKKVAIKNEVQRRDSSIRFEGALEGKTFEDKASELKEIEDNIPKAKRKKRNIDEKLKQETQNAFSQYSSAVSDFVGGKSFTTEEEFQSFFKKELTQKKKARGALTESEQSFLKVITDPSSATAAQRAAMAGVFGGFTGSAAVRATLSGFGDVAKAERDMADSIGKAKYGLSASEYALRDMGVGDSKYKDLVKAETKKVEKIAENMGGVQAMGAWMKDNDELRKQRDREIASGGVSVETTRRLTESAAKFNANAKDQGLTYSDFINSGTFNVTRGLLKKVGTAAEDMKSARGGMQLEGLINANLLGAGYIKEGLAVVSSEADYTVGKYQDAKTFTDLTKKGVTGGFTVEDAKKAKALFQGSGKDLINQFSEDEKKKINKFLNKKDISQQDAEEFGLAIGTAVIGTGKSEAIQENMYERAKQDLNTTSDNVMRLAEKLDAKPDDANIKKELEKEERRQRSLEGKVRALQPDQTGGGGGSVNQQSTHVQPPAMNYWNNRWAL